jgi:16S rRNA (cytidine1402-2'-O)-methyltransferase
MINQGAESLFSGKMENYPGTLFIVSTPIGNLGDITLRALETLRKVDIIAAEDTRKTRKLTSAYHISTPLISYHEHNKRQRGKYLLTLLQQGKSIALVSDSGTPGISDPGADLILEVLREEIPIVPLPGPCALITALIISGLPTPSFVYEGFLPRSGKKRREKLEKLADVTQTIILFEAPTRLINTLEEISQLWGERKAAISRELTKKFEEVRRGKISELLTYYRNHPPRGEICIVLEGKTEKIFSTIPPIEEQLLALFREGLSLREAVKIVTRNKKISKREVYQQAIKLKSRTDETSG